MALRGEFLSISTLSPPLPLLSPSSSIESPCPPHKKKKLMLFVEFGTRGMIVRVYTLANRNVGRYPSDGGVPGFGFFKFGGRKSETGAFEQVISRFIPSSACSAFGLSRSES